ncbi:unnamed protein product [Phaeothamnion confervicola]
MESRSHRAASYSAAQMNWRCSENSARLNPKRSRRCSGRATTGNQHCGTSTCGNGGWVPTTLLREGLSVLFPTHGPEQEFSVGQAIQAYGQALEAWEIARRAEMVVKDCGGQRGLSSTLTNFWSGQSPTRLTSVLSSKFSVKFIQERPCYALFANGASGFFAIWRLNDATGKETWQAEVLGTFPEGEAREFLSLRLENLKTKITVSDEDWRRVYEMCDGNAKALRRAALDFHLTESKIWSSGGWRCERKPPFTWRVLRLV